MKFRFLLAVGLLALAIPVKLSAFEFGLGLSALEEGDDRIRPGVLAQIGFNDLYFGRMHFYGRKYSVVTERTLVFAAHRRFDVFNYFGLEFLRAGAGLTFMDEMIEVDIPGDSASDRNEHAVNVGGSLGAYARVPGIAPFIFEASWESHIYLAGEASLFMATGRKQFISLTAGVEF